MSDKCKGCGASIRWIKTTRGKSMPVDPEEVTIATRGGMTYRGFISHWATCSESEQFKAEGKSTPGMGSLQWQCLVCKQWYTKGHACRECGTMEGDK